MKKSAKVVRNPSLSAEPKLSSQHKLQWCHAVMHSQADLIWPDSPFKEICELLSFKYFLFSDIRQRYREGDLGKFRDATLVKRQFHKIIMRRFFPSFVRLSKLKGAFSAFCIVCCCMISQKIL
jgi:hypothetical protein